MITRSEMTTLPLLPSIHHVMFHVMSNVASLLFLLNSGATVIGLLVLWNLCLIMNAYLLSFVFFAVCHVIGEADKIEYC